MTRKQTFILSIMMLSCFLWPAATYAESPYEVKVIHPAAVPADNTVELNIFFTILDKATNQPIPQANIEAASIQLVGNSSLGSNAPITATVDIPKTPFYVAMLLDKSGSMKNVMPSLREAAISAIDTAPPTAYFAVIPFNVIDINQNQSLHPIQDFTDQHDQVKRVIEKVEAEQKSTCLYDAMYQAIDLVDKKVQQPQERRAIIVFTDGKDVTGDGKKCSFYGYDNVIDKAKPRNGPLTPIYTIGLCADKECSNINKIEIMNLAKDTSAVYAIGQQNDLRQMFQDIMNGLNSQWVARANICARPGENQAALIVKLRDVDTPLSTTFNFSADRELCPPPQVVIQATTPNYKKENHSYVLPIDINERATIDKVTVEFGDNERNLRLDKEENHTPDLKFAEHSAGGLEAGHAYYFLITAIDKMGKSLAETKIVFTPGKEVETKLFSVDSVKIQNENLLIDLNLLDKTQTFNKYDGFITSKETGQKVHEFGPVLFADRRIQVILPATILEGEQAGYQVTIYLTTKDEQRLPPDSYEFTYVPPSFWQKLFRLWPIILGGFILLVMVAGGWFIYHKWPRQADVLNAPSGPPLDYTVIEEEPVRPGLRLLLTVLETPNPADKTTRQIDKVTYVVGRGNECDFTIHDRAVSRSHLQIRIHNGYFTLTDLNSSYGTEVNGKKLIAYKESEQFNGAIDVKLGAKTRIRLES